MYLTAGVIYAVLLAFTVIAVWEQYTAAKDTVNDEATALTTMYRSTEAMPRSERPELRRLIREYTAAKRPIVGRTKRPRAAAVSRLPAGVVGRWCHTVHQCLT